MGVQAAERFILKSAAISAELRAALQSQKVAAIKSDLEKATDALVSRHLNQVTYEIRTSARRMSEFYELFYILENDIRRFIDDILSDVHQVGWWERCAPPEVKKNAFNNRQRESKEGLPPRSPRMIDYTTFGHLGEIIKWNWDTFAGIFPNCEIERLEKVMSRLNLARGPIAHCGFLPEDESVRLKLAIRDWFALME